MEAGERSDRVAALIEVREPALRSNQGNSVFRLQAPSMQLNIEKPVGY